MKYIRWIIALMFLVGYGAAFGQSQPTKASIMENAFGAIRADMVRDACNILEYNDQILLGKITNISIIDFDKELTTRLNASSGDLTAARYLQLIIRDANNAAGGGLGGDDLSIYQTRINSFRSGLKTAYENGDRLMNLFGEDSTKLETKRETIAGNDSKYLVKIDNLFRECQTYNQLEADGKLDEYKGVVFKSLIEEKSGATTPIQPKPKQETRPNPVDKNDDVEQNPKTEENSIEFEQNSALKECISWPDYVVALQRWPKDKSLIEKVDEACWKICKGTDEIEDYEQYLNTLKEYGRGNHYKEAKQRIEELRAANGDRGEGNSGNGNAGTGGSGGGDDTKDGNGLWYMIAAIMVFALLLTLFLRKRKKNQSQVVLADKELKEENAAFERCSTISACDYYLNTYPSGRFVKEVIAKKEGLLDKMQKEEDEAFKACTTITACDFYLIKYPQGRYVNDVKEKKIKLTEGGNNPKPNPEPENKPKPEPKQKQGEWVVVGASVKGNGHIQSNMPCQDNHKFELLGKGWGIAVVSDGAGSAAHSELGSKVVVERGAVHFKSLIEKEGWIVKNALPSDAEWLQKSYFVLKTIRNEVEMVAKKNNVELKSLSATCLAVVFSPLGLLAVHVGDGRIGCKTASGGWKAIMTPHKGEEANQTLFLVSDFWDIPNYVQSGVLVPESIVVREPVEAFALMSDGCESTAWLCTAKNAETGKYYDQNKPFEGFFNPLEETMASFHQDNVPEKERQEKWYKFIESGTKGFVKEQDDKTMVLGVFL